MATSDEQRAAFEVWVRNERPLWDTGSRMIAVQAWQACAAQQAPQVRADRLEAALRKIASMQVRPRSCTGQVACKDIARTALAANPQQIAPETKEAK